MRRHIGRFSAALLLAIVPAILGALGALLYSDAGTLLLGRLVSEELTAAFRGHFEIARVSGSFLGGIELTDVHIRDSSNAPFADVKRIVVTYALPNLLAGQIIFTSAELDDPVIHLIKRKNGRLNHQEIFRLGEGPPGGGSSPLVAVRDLRIRRGLLELRLPWNPPDTALTTADTLAALAIDRAKPGRTILETPDGRRKVVILADLNAYLPLLSISTPDRKPLSFDIDGLSTRISDPAITVVDLAAHGWTHDDSLGFTLHRAALPDSRFSGGGVITWPHGPVLYDFTLAATRLNLDDLHWISPVFPALIGSARVTAKWRTEQQTSYRLQHLVLRGDAGRITGKVTALVDNHRGLGVEDMALDLVDMDLDVPRPYVDTLPLHGTLTGRVSGAGFKDGMDLVASLLFRDRDVPGSAQSRMLVAGHLVLGGPLGTLFDTLQVSESDIDLRTVQHISPSVALRGRLGLIGALSGPWRNVTFTGTVRHQDDSLPESRAIGVVTLDTRQDTVAFNVAVRVDPLVFDGVRPSYPGIPIRGAVTGPVKMRGTTGHFALDVALAGDIGALAAQGTIAQSPGHLEADSLVAHFEGLDLALLRGTGPPTRLSGRLEADGSIDSVAGPSGTLAVDLQGGSVLELPLDSLHLRVRGDAGRIQVDTVQLAAPAGVLAGAGTLGWDRTDQGSIVATFDADSLTPLQSFLERFVGPTPDTGVAALLQGRMHGELEILGSAGAPRLLVRATGEGVAWRGVRAPTASVSVGVNAAVRPELGIGIRVDSLLAGRFVLNDVNALLGGYQDSLHWGGNASLNNVAEVTGTGSWWSPRDSSLLAIDSIRIVLPRHDWRLRAPASVTLRDGHIDLTPLELEATDGSGTISLAGRIPRADAGDMQVSAVGLELQDIYALLELDTTGVGGSVHVDMAVGGTAASPTFQGTASVADLAYGELGSPFVQGIVHYADHLLDANLLMWKTGVPVLRVEGRLPLDLALGAVPARQLDGPISVRVIADSTDLSLVEAFTKNLRRVRGTMRADVEVTGTWDRPELRGAVQLQDVSATVPGLGVRYQDVNLAAHLAGDSIRVDSLFARSGEGTLRSTGGLRLIRLTDPVFDLTLHARRFRVIDVRRFLTLDATGSVTLTGPVLQPQLTGRITADEGNLHFADLLTKRIVDLENPGDSGLIDLDLVRAERLGANFQSRFLDSLTINTLQIQMGESFWLRSSEANIQLDGDLTVNKHRDVYRYDGTLNAVRGNYTLRIGGVVSNDFTVERGTVRYFGTPDLNAELDIEARHDVIAAITSEEIPVIARITGTLLQPKLELASPATSSRPALSQTELVSYLMFGRPTFSLQGPNGQGSQYAAVQAGVSYLTSAFSSELQRALISDLGVPIDYLDIRTGGVGGGGIGGQGGSAQVATVAAGWQLGRRWFVTLVADVCTNTYRFYPNAEFRISHGLRLKTSVEPTYSCQAASTQPAFSASKYQVGLDLLWEREY
ncbi:MAG: translocation/assembly module TamB domain-containing protein [Gemmatimonadales bacterium]